MSETVPFEGVEKRLVIQFANGKIHYDEGLQLGEGPLMKSPLVITAEEWQSVLNHASCEIVSKKELSGKPGVEGINPGPNSGDVRVYLLSESTLTVWSTGFLMKTCGRTTPFLAMQRLLDLYRCKSLSDLHVSWMTYSRLDFLYPEFQPSPHRNFAEEVEYAKRCFLSISTCEDTDSDATSSGSTSASGTSSPILGTRVVKSMKTNNPHFSYGAIPAGQHTLYAMFAAPCDLPASGYAMEEVLMTKVREDCVRQLTGADNQSERRNMTNDDIEAKSIIRKELAKSPNSVLDEFWFDPCGYSANILFKNRNKQIVDYFSTHISPEPCSSYASLEVGTWGNKSSFCRHDNEFSLKPLIDPFESLHKNITRIVIRPINHEHEERFKEDDHHRGFSRIFESARFTCSVSHFAE